MPQLDTTVAVPGGQLHAVAVGDGPPIVLVHSAIVDMRAWDPMVPLLVAADYLAIRYDTRRVGSSPIAARLAEGVAGTHLVGLEAPAELANSIVGHLAPLPRWA